MENKFGVLSRIAGLFSRRGYNIYSLAVSPTEDPRFSRMTVVVDGDTRADRAGHQAAEQLIPVIRITELQRRNLAVERDHDW